MRFPTMFQRRVGEAPLSNPPWPDPPPDPAAPAIAALGSDKVPEGKPGKADNFHESKLVNLNGFPAQRVAVGVVGPKEALGRHLVAALYLHEDRTDAWLRVPGDRELVVGGIGYFDAPCLLDHGRSRSEDDSHNPGSLEVVLVVDALAPGLESTVLPPGVYSFVVGTDVSNPGR